MHQDWSQRLGGNTFTAEQIEQARAGETFAVLESELSKLVSLQGETVDWALVQTAAQSYLENEGSDLLVATWLVLAAFVQQNAVGLQQSLGVLVRLHQECWETMTPPLRRMRARRNQMQWFIEQLVRQVEQSQLELAPEHYEVVVALWQELTQCWFKYDEEPPAFTSLLSVLVCAESDSTETAGPKDETLIPAAKEAPALAPEKKSELHLEQAPQVKAPKPIAPVVAQPIELTQSSLSNVAQLEQQVDEVFALVLRGLGELSSDLLLEPLLYRFTRAAAWISLNQLPSATERITRLPAPSSQERERLEQLQDQDALAVLAYVESRVVGHRYWLDLHHAAYQAALKLEQGALIADTIAQESAHFVQRLLGVEKLLFQDETPFASTVTQQWLQQLLSPRGIEASKPVPSVKTEFVVDDALSLDMSMVALLAGAQAQAQVAAQNLLALEQQLGQNLDRFLNK